MVLAVAMALTRVEATLPSTGALLAACRRIVPMEPGLGLVLVLGFLALGFLVVALGARSLVRQLRAQRRFLRALEPLATVEIGSQAVALIESETLHAFCAGLLRPRIYLSTAARAGNALFGLWWLDPVAALIVAGVAVREGLETWRGEGCCAAPGLGLATCQDDGCG